PNGSLVSAANDNAAYDSELTICHSAFAEEDLDLDDEAFPLGSGSAGLAALLEANETGGPAESEPDPMGVPDGDCDDGLRLVDYDAWFARTYPGIMRLSSVK